MLQKICLQFSGLPILARLSAPPIPFIMPGWVSSSHYHSCGVRGGRLCSHTGGHRRVPAHLPTTPLEHIPLAEAQADENAPSSPIRPFGGRIHSGGAAACRHPLVFDPDSGAGPLGRPLLSQAGTGPGRICSLPSSREVGVSSPPVGVAVARRCGLREGMKGVHAPVYAL
jgi:hypothetical protein